MGDVVNMQTRVGAKNVTASMSGAEMVIEALQNEKVEVLFGHPGGAILPIYDALYDTNIKHVLAKHEQGAIHAAEGYAKVTGKPGVVISTSGPGATNLVTGIADAMMDSLPLVIFTGQVSRNVIGTDAFQESDVIGITMPITKHNYQVQHAEELPRVIKEAFHIATTGRPGPVLIDIPKDVSLEKAEVNVDLKINLPGYNPNTSPNLLQIKKLQDVLATAKKPVLLAGAGVMHAKASDLLLAFAEKNQIPVVNTLLGLGSFPANHPLFLGMGGMHGGYAANMAMYECDLLINIGARFDDRLTGNVKHFAPNAQVAHIDIDPAEIGKIVMTQIPIVADAKEALQKLLEDDHDVPNRKDWKNHLKKYREEYPFWYQKKEGTLSPQYVIQLIDQYTDDHTIITTDVGQHQMWAAQHYNFKQPNRLVTSGGLGTMGYGFPAAIGAQLAEPHTTVVSIVGDGGFQMTLQELSLLKELSLPVKVVVMNNGSLGMVRQWQDLLYDERYSASLLPIQPDYVKLAEAYGIRGIRVETEEEAEKVLKETLNDNEPILIDCAINPTEKVFPMIPPGKGANEMIGVKP